MVYCSEGGGSPSHGAYVLIQGICSHIPDVMSECRDSCCASLFLTFLWLRHHLNALQPPFLTLTLSPNPCRFFFSQNKFSYFISFPSSSHMHGTSSLLPQVLIKTFTWSSTVPFFTRSLVLAFKVVNFTTSLHVFVGLRKYRARDIQSSERMIPYLDCGIRGESILLPLTDHLHFLFFKTNVY